MSANESDLLKRNVMQNSHHPAVYLHWTSTSLTRSIFCLLGERYISISTDGYPLHTQGRCKRGGGDDIYILLGVNCQLKVLLLFLLTFIKANVIWGFFNDSIKYKRVFTLSSFFPFPPMFPFNSISMKASFRPQAWQNRQILLPLYFLWSNLAVVVVVVVVVVVA